MEKNSSFLNLHCWLLLVFINFLTAQKNELISREINELVNSSIEKGAFPGAQVFLKIDNEIIINKSYGFHTYDSIIQVDNNHIYDLASLTKVFGPTISLMKIFDDYKINPHEPISNYVSELKKSNKKNTTFHEALSHSGGWIPYINHQQNILKKNGNYKKRFVRTEPNNKFSVAITENLFLKESFQKKIYKKIKRSKINKPGQYLYSGLFFFYVPKIIENLTGLSYSDYLKNNFYNNLTNNNLTFKPENKLLAVPTEIDEFFRKSLVHGSVHDEASSFFSGLSGNAGLFGSAESIGELIRNLETWSNGQKIFNNNTIEKFTKYATNDLDNPRGLGFDKPTRNNTNEYPHKDISPKSFGHTGFTGTFFWVDPELKMSLVFLTNRVYPSRKNLKLYDLDVRKKLLEIIIKHSKN